MGRKPAGSGPSPSKQAKGRKQNWTLAEDEILLEILKDMLVRGKGKPGNYSKEQWDAIAALYLEKSGDESVDKSNLQGRLKTLRKKYTLNSQLKDATGWSWDNDKHMSIPPDNKAWAEKLAKNPDYNKVKNKPFPQYNSMHFLLGKDIAHGRCHSGKTQDNNEGQGSSARSGSDIRDGGDGGSGCNLQEHIVDDGIVGRSQSQCAVPHLYPLTEDVPPVIATPTPIRWSTGGDSSLSGKWRRSIDTSSVGQGRTLAPGEPGIENLFSLHKQQLEVQQNYVSLRANALIDHAKEEAEKAEGLKKMKELPGLPRHYLAVGTTALQKRELRQCILMLEGEDLAVWLQQQYILTMNAVNPMLLQEINRDRPILSQLVQVMDTQAIYMSQLEGAQRNEH